jgi:hypothetical protein
MTNEIVKKEENEKLVSLEARLEEIKKEFSDPIAFDQERGLIRRLHQLRGNKELPEAQKKEKLDKSINELGMFYGLENGLWAANLDHQKYYLPLTRMRQKVISDYNCKTSAELMLADSIVSSYWRIIKNEMRINRLVEKEDGKFSFDQLKINVLKELNKEVDLANRRMNMNIILLKEMKQPALKVNVKTNNAFIGENQQFNNNQNNEAT